MQDLNAVLNRDFSTQRLLTYRNFLKLELKLDEYTPEQTYNVYAWNELVAGCFWQVISRIEIILRNRINNLLLQTVHANWLDVNDETTKVFFNKSHKNAIKQTQRKLIEKGLQARNDRVVAELNMGFWANFYEIEFSYSPKDAKSLKIGWQYFMPDIFIGYQYQENVDKVRYWHNAKNVQRMKEHLNIAKEIRNRIAHHEPIFNYTPSYLAELSKKDKDGFIINIDRNYNHLLELLHWLSPEQAMLYQKSYHHHYTKYLLSSVGFRKYLNVEADEMMMLDGFIEYLMNYLSDTNPPNPDKMIHVSRDSAYFGCFIPAPIKT